MLVLQTFSRKFEAFLSNPSHHPFLNPILMRKIVLLTGALGLSLSLAQAQQLPGFEIAPGKPVVCPSRPEDMFTSRPAPAEFRNPNRTQRRGTARQAVINVKYTGFTPEAQAAFQFAVNIWQTLLTSPVDINVDAQWTRLGTGVLGSAGATTVMRNFSGAPLANVWYPVALAEKIAGQDLNGVGNPEIVANFSSQAQWYLGTDGVAVAGKTDFVSVVLHELCHGLGFVAATGYDINTRLGSYGTNAGGSPLPWVFSTFIETAAGRRVTDLSFAANPSETLGTEFTGNALYFNSPLAAAVNPEEEKRPQLYAPVTFSRGSSISHLDEDRYPAGTPHSLMSPQIGRAEVIHDPGALTRKMFDEMGWFVTAIRHVPLRDTETLQATTVTATVESDGTVTAGSVKAFYSFNNGAFSSVTLTPTGTAGQYQGTIPNPGTNVTVRYYLSAADNETGRTYTAPGAPAPGITTRQVYQFIIGPDAVAPQAAHTPPLFLATTQLPYEFVVQAADNIGVASVVVNYTINNVARTPIILTRQADNRTYRGSLTTAGGPINGGDVLRYSVVVTDVSARANQFSLGPFTVAIKTPLNQYVTDFNTANSDFSGTGFSILTPDGFANAAIHSNHPYADRTTLIYQLLQPILVKSDPAQATVKFDEIVLAEPGEPGSVFGSVSFYDFVVTEGSLDGRTWIPLSDGYNSRDTPIWKTAYDAGVSTTSNGSSTTVGTPALFQPRTISLRDKFAAGATVQVRFRLTSDDGATGWGWAIDNLNIQGQTGTSTKDQLTAGGLSVFPNPSSTGELRVRARLARPTAGLQVQVRNVLGQSLLRQAVPGTATQLDLPLNLSALPAGLYFVSLESGSETVTRKVIIQK